MTITHKLKIDLMRQEIYPPVSVVQGDTYSREVAISLYSGGAPWELPNGHDIAIRYSKPDGTPGIYDTLPDGSRAWSTDGNTVSVMLCPQMLTCPGKVSAQVIIIVGERILATFPFTVAVAPDPSAGTVRSEPYYNWRNAFLPQTTGAKVGQYLQISKVDDAGRITEMAPAENPAGEATNKAYEALRIANYVAQEIKAYSPSGTRSIAEEAMRRANSRLVAPPSASVGQYFRVAAVDANGMVTAVEAVDAPSGGNGGMTTAQVNAIDGMFKVCAYDDSKDISGAYEAFNNAFGLNVPATGITLSKTALNFAETASQFITATVEPENSTDTVVWTTSDPSVATVVNGVVTPVANGNCTITATAGNVSVSCSVFVAFEVEVVYYTVTNNLTGCVSNNNAVSIVEGGSYSATLTADEGYTLDGANISIMVNGEDMTDTAYADGVITIPNVLGNVVITATAVEEGAGGSGEVVMLKNISFDGTSYLDTEVIPESVNYRYVLGIQMPNKDLVVNKNFGGISMRDHTDLAKSSYWDLYWYATVSAHNYNPDIPRVAIYESCMGLLSGDHGITAGDDKGDGASTQPFDYPVYYNLDNGNQAMWLNEELTEPPVPGHFQKISATTDFNNQSNYTDDEHPIDSIWLGKVRVTGIMSSLATEANTYAGVKFYCFKVYDSDENLIADMRPAKQGNTVGMWDNVRNKFFPAIGTANYEEVSA